MAEDAFETSVESEDDSNAWADLIESELLSEEETCYDVGDRNSVSGVSETCQAGWNVEHDAASAEMNNSHSLKRKHEAAFSEILDKNSRHTYSKEDACKLPSEVVLNILKFLSCEDLLSCALVCRTMRIVASEDSLWHRLYKMRWGLPHPENGELRQNSWKSLYSERDRMELPQFGQDCPAEFCQYYKQMHLAKRSLVPDPSKFTDDLLILDTTLGEKIKEWKKNFGLPDVFTGNHVCSGRKCTYSRVGDVFLCERTGIVHVCDHTCRETVFDLDNQNLVCPISGRCTDEWVEELSGQQRKAYGDFESFHGMEQLGDAFALGYNCTNEGEFQAALRVLWMHGVYNLNCTYVNSKNKILEIGGEEAW